MFSRTGSMRLHLIITFSVALLFTEQAIASGFEYTQCPEGAEVCLSCELLKDTTATHPELTGPIIEYFVSHDGNGGLKGLFISSNVPATNMGVGALLISAQLVRNPYLFRGFAGLQISLRHLYGLLIDRAGLTLGMYWCDENPAACPGGGLADIGRKFYLEEVRKGPGEDPLYGDSKVTQCTIIPRP